MLFVPERSTSNGWINRFSAKIVPTFSPQPDRISEGGHRNTSIQAEPAGSGPAQFDEVDAHAEDQAKVASHGSNVRSSLAFDLHHGKAFIDIEQLASIDSSCADLHLHCGDPRWYVVDPPR